MKLPRVSFPYFITVFFISSVLYVMANAQTSRNVVIEVTAESVSAGEGVYITGNQDELGGWNPLAVPMQNVSGKLYKKEIQVADGTRIEYKFTKGSWETEAMFEPGVVPDNCIADIKSDTVLKHTIKAWSMSQNKVTHGQITGKVDYYKAMKGEGILPRDVVVWTPPGYESDTTRRYPVIYMHDGQNVFDPATASFGYDWEADEHADSLIRSGVIEPVIIVGMYCTSNRTPEYSYGKEAKAYMNFIINVVKPMIDADYRTKPDRMNTAVAGSSMGGLISLVILWSYPEVFSKAGCFSPAFKIGSLDYADVVKDLNAPKQDCLIYVDNGGVGLDAQLQPGIDDMLKVLQKKGFTMGENLFWVKDEKADHNERAWASRISNPLLLFYKIDKKIK
jgi:predicted alpha/beta superfamily hydrolase